MQVALINCSDHFLAKLVMKRLSHGSVEAGPALPTLIRMIFAATPKEMHASRRNDRLASPTAPTRQRRLPMPQQDCKRPRPPQLGGIAARKARRSPEATPEKCQQIVMAFILLPLSALVAAAAVVVHTRKIRCTAK